MKGLIGKVDKNIINKNLNKIKEADIILIQLEIPINTVKYICEIAKGKKIILDPAPANFKIMNKEILKKIHIIKPNETELSILMKKSIDTLEDIIEASKKIINMGAENVIVSLGEKGAVLVNKEGYKCFSALKTTVIDTTAAGDSFIAGVALGIAKGKNITESIEFATKVASITVSRQGAQKSIPSKEEVDNIDN